MERVLNGSPWNVNKRAVLIKRFDPNLRPADIRFNQLPIWVRIMNLPLGLMNNKWGSQLAGMVGEVEKLETDEQGRAWGPYLRAKVVIEFQNPSVVVWAFFQQDDKRMNGMMCSMKTCPFFAFLVEL